jgi:1-acyl-sn-glycerol-3-phosphate acyltransferase
MSESRGLPRRFARWVVRRFYADIEIIDGDRIPQSGPMLLCANHANSLIDSVVVGITAQRPVRFMAKAPLFDLPVLGPLMHAIGMVPAFRAMDDKKQVRRNLESLDVGAGVLIDGHAMGIFPEGRSTDEMHLVKVRTGAARMALQAVEAGTTDVRIVPIGIAYQRKEQFRSAVLVRVAEPIVAAEFLAAEDGNVPRARRAVTAELDTRLKGVVIHLANPDWQPWLDDLDILVPTPPRARASAIGALWQRKRIADAINYFWDNDRPRAEALAAEVASYRGHVEASGLRVDSEVLRLTGFGVSLTLLWKFLWLVALFIVVRKLDSVMGEPGKMAVATHKVIFGVPVYTLWHLGVITALWFFSEPRFAIAWLFLAPIAGAIALTYWREARRVAWLLFHETRVLLARDELLQLRDQRAALREHLTEMSEEFDKVSPANAR